MYELFENIKNIKGILMKKRVYKTLVNMGKILLTIDLLLLLAFGKKNEI